MKPMDSAWEVIKMAMGPMRQMESNPLTPEGTGDSE